MTNKYDEAKQYVLANQSLMKLVNKFPEHIKKSEVDKWEIGFKRAEHCNPHTRVFTAFGLGFGAYTGVFGDSQVKQFATSLPGGLAEDLFMDALNMHMEEILRTMGHEAAKRAHDCHEELCDEM